MNKFLCALAMIAMLYQAAVAGEAYNVCFYSMDRNGDDVVVLEEFSAAMVNAEGSVFQAADADGNGELVHDEWEAYKESQGFEDHHG